MHFARAAALTIVAACTPAPKDEPASPVPAAAQAVIDELEDARRQSTEAQARQLLSAAQLHIAQTTSCPADVQAMATSKVIEKAPRDPWNHDYVLECRDNGASVIVVSLGPDGERRTKDDILVETHEF